MNSTDFSCAGESRTSPALLRGLVVIAFLCFSAFGTAQNSPTLQESESSTEINQPETGTLPDSMLQPLDLQLPARAFGYVLGDVLIQRIQLPLEIAEFDLAQISTESRISEWLARQNATLELLADGSKWLELHYQIVNSPTAIISSALPELTLTFSTHTMMVDAWPFSVGPLTLDNSALVAIDENITADKLVAGQLLPDEVLAPLDTIAPAAQARYALWGLLGCLLTWGIWWYWRERRDAVRLPFAGAFRDIKKLHSSNIDDNELVWKALHNAFNSSAGYAVNANSMECLFNSHTWLTPLQDRVQAFYRASSARFFEIPPRHEQFPVTDLAKALYLAEKSNSK